MFFSFCVKYYIHKESKTSAYCECIFSTNSIVDTPNDYASQSYSLISSSVLSPFFLLLLIASVRSIIIWNSALSPKFHVASSLSPWISLFSLWPVTLHLSQSVKVDSEHYAKQPFTFKGRYKVTIGSALTNTIYLPCNLPIISLLWGCIIYSLNYQ